MQYFKEIGSLINDRWLAVNYDEDQFAAIAIGVLKEHPAHLQVKHSEVIDWLSSTDTLPYQPKLDEAFGQPPITMYWNGRFQIDVLFWHTATTAIHQHAFCGAFEVLSGSSLHSKYEFQIDKKINARLLLGKLSLRNVEFLQAGAVREIGRGAMLVHALFHLETPSVTIVIRTCRDTQAGPEFAYQPPCVAIDPERSDALLTKRLQCLELLARINAADDFERVASAILSRGDFVTTYFVLLQARLLGKNQDIYERLAAISRQRHGEDVDRLSLAIDEERRRKSIAERRKSVFGVGHRFLLALLMNFSDRQSINDLIQLRFPDQDASALIEKWLIEMATQDSLGIQLDTVGKILLGCCLRDCSTEDVIQTLEKRYPHEEIRPRVDEIKEACRLIQQNEFLRPLFSSNNSSTR